MRPFLLLVLILLATPSISQEYFKQEFPKAVTYQPCDTQIVVYDARPELGMGTNNINSRALEMISKLGIRIIRHTLYWNLMEAYDKPGLYDAKYLSEWDTLVENCRKEGFILDVVVNGDPLGVTFVNRIDAYRRFAQFVADMARRYPSVVYWELFDEMDSGFTCLFGAKDNVSMLEQGKYYAEMLKIVYPALKAANPSAWVLTGGINDTDEFPRGIYEGGGRDYFDIMNIHTNGVSVVNAFVERGKRIREIMAAYGDETKPLWNTKFGLDARNIIAACGYPHEWNPPQDDAKVFDTKQLEDYKACLKINDQLKLYQKLLPYQFQAGNERNDDGMSKSRAKLPDGKTIDDYGFGIVRSDMSPRPTYEWLAETQPNEAIIRKPRFTTNVTVRTKHPMIPIGYDYKEIEGGIQIQRVIVDSAIPTRIYLRFAPERSVSRSNGKTDQPGTQVRPERSTPLPDPFDI